VVAFLFSQSISAQSLPAPSKTQPVLLSSGDWHPLISPKLDRYGVISEVVMESFDLVGYTSAVRFWPWPRTLVNLDAGNVHASYAWRKTEDRQARYYFSDSVYDTGNVFFYRKGFSFDWQTVEDLKGYRIGGVHGYAYSQEIIEAEKQGVIKLDRVVEEKQLVFMWLAGHIDAFPSSSVVGWELFKQYAPDHLDQVTTHPKAVSKNPIFLIVRKTPEGKALLDKFNEGLRRLKSSGRYDEIYSR